MIYTVSLFQCGYIFISEIINLQKYKESLVLFLREYNLQITANSTLNDKIIN